MRLTNNKKRLSLLALKNQSEILYLSRFKLGSPNCKMTVLPTNSDLSLFFAQCSLLESLTMDSLSTGLRSTLSASVKTGLV